MNNKTTLVVMAAGMGSRYGGLKQIDPIGPNGEIILDFSIYDAVKAGFDKAVFIIRRDIEKDFREMAGKRIENMIDTEYVFQDMDYLPAGRTVPQGRAKPWGTGHAVYCARDKADTPFALINADDYYGSSSFKLICDSLKSSDEMCMVGFKLGNTLTENGYVSRGICTVAPDGTLTDLVERTHIEIRDGKAEVSGTVRVTVLYTPEGEGGIRTLEFAMPFTVETDGRSLPDCAALLADTEPELLETRMLNPRKVFTHCKLVTRLTGYQRRPLCFCTDAEAGPELCIEKKQEQQHAIVLTHIAEKDFTFSEQMDLSPGREGAAEILTSRVNSTVTETKIVGSKLLFKGIFTVSLLYRTADGRCCAASGELPFSQILEVEGAPEGAEPSVRLQFTGADLQVDGADAEGREIAVTLYLHATALLRQTQELTLLSDLYSTAYDLTYDAAPLELTSFREQFTRRQTVREVLEIGVVADSILALSVTCGAVSVSREGAGVVLRTGASVRALYLDEGGVPLVAERSIDVSCQLELPEDCRVAARAVCPEEVQGSLTDRGIEVRFPVDFRAEAAQRVKRVCVSAGKINTDAPKETTGAPSLVLRCLGKQETAWDLAKRYNTTIGVILAANQLETEGDISRDQLLLIPRKRT